VIRPSTGPATAQIGVPEKAWVTGRAGLQFFEHPLRLSKKEEFY